MAPREVRGSTAQATQSMHETRKDARQARFKPTWFTRLGAIFILLILFVGLVAIVLSNNLLYLLVATMLGFVTASGVLAEYTLAHLTVCARASDGPFAREPTTLDLEVSNEKLRFPALCLTGRAAAEGPFGRDMFRVGHLPAGRTVRVRCLTTFARRGWNDLEGIWIATRFPFSFFEKATFVPCPGRALAYPAPLPAPLFETLASAPQGDADRTARGRGEAVVGVREYATGDPWRLIHWKRSASVGRFVVKEFERETDRRLVLVLAPLDGDPLEDGASIATWILLRAHEDGITTTLVTHQATLGPAHGRDHLHRCLEALALLAPAASPWEPSLTGLDAGDDSSVVVIHDPSGLPDWAAAADCSAIAAGTARAA